MLARTVIAIYNIKALSRNINNWIELSVRLISQTTLNILKYLKWQIILQRLEYLMRDVTAHIPSFKSLNFIYHFFSMCPGADWGMYNIWYKLLMKEAMSLTYIQFLLGTSKVSAQPFCQSPPESISAKNTWYERKLEIKEK